jgi:Zn-dependent peptidase ImmA (M78 family)
MNRREIALDAAARALRLRQSFGVALQDAISVYDFAHDLVGVGVHFADVPSMEGMYRKRPEPLILISSLRPPGRQAFTCGHELGHHIYGHGLRVDELIDESRNPVNVEELQANFFSSFLLMPSVAVSSAFAKRGWNVKCPTPEQIYTVAEWLGVGYTTLIWHMATSLNFIGQALAQSLSKVPTEQIRRRLLGKSVKEHLIVADRYWDGAVKAVDAQVGHFILAPRTTLAEGKTICLVQEDSRSALYQAIAPGMGRLLNPELDWGVFVRVSRKGYTGRSIYRHYEECDDEMEDNE